MNIYCDSNKKLILNREENFWSGKVGDLTIKVSQNFKPLLNWGSDKFIYFLKYKTWKGARIEKGIIVPSRDWSLSFIDGLPAYKGESRIKSYSAKDGEIEVHGEFTSFNKKEGTGTRHGLIISHTGTISVVIERIGHLSIEEKKDVIIDINRDGTFKEQ